MSFSSISSTNPLSSTNSFDATSSATDTTNSFSPTTSSANSSSSSSCTTSNTIASPPLEISATPTSSIESLAKCIPTIIDQIKEKTRIENIYLLKHACADHPDFSVSQLFPSLFELVKSGQSEIFLVDRSSKKVRSYSAVESHQAALEEVLCAPLSTSPPEGWSEVAFTYFQYLNIQKKSPATQQKILENLLKYPPKGVSKKEVKFFLTLFELNRTLAQPRRLSLKTNKASPLNRLKEIDINAFPLHVESVKEIFIKITRDISRFLPTEADIENWKNLYFSILCLHVEISESNLIETESILPFIQAIRSLIIDQWNEGTNLAAGSMSRFTEQYSAISSIKTARSPADSTQPANETTALLPDQPDEQMIYQLLTTRSDENAWIEGLRKLYLINVEISVEEATVLLNKLCETQRLMINDTIQKNVALLLMKIKEDSLSKDFIHAIVLYISKSFRLIEQRNSNNPFTIIDILKRKNPGAPLEAIVHLSGILAYLATKKPKELPKIITSKIVKSFIANHNKLAKLHIENVKADIASIPRTNQKNILQLIPLVTVKSKKNLTNILSKNDLFLKNSEETLAQSLSLAGNPFFEKLDGVLDELEKIRLFTSQQEQKLATQYDNLIDNELDIARIKKTLRSLPEKTLDQLAEIIFSWLNSLSISKSDPFQPFGIFELEEKDLIKHQIIQECFRQKPLSKKLSPNARSDWKKILCLSVATRVFQSRFDKTTLDLVSQLENSQQNVFSPEEIDAIKKACNTFLKNPISPASISWTMLIKKIAVSQSDPLLKYTFSNISNKLENIISQKFNAIQQLDTLKNCIKGVIERSDLMSNQKLNTCLLNAIQSYRTHDAWDAETEELLLAYLMKCITWSQSQPDEAKNLDQLEQVLLYLNTQKEKNYLLSKLLKQKEKIKKARQIKEQPINQEQTIYISFSEEIFSYLEDKQILKGTNKSFYYFDTEKVENTKNEEKQKTILFTHHLYKTKKKAIIELIEEKNETEKTKFLSRNLIDFLEKNQWLLLLPIEESQIIEKIKNHASKKTTNLVNLSITNQHDLINEISSLANTKTKNQTKKNENEIIKKLNEYLQIQQTLDSWNQKSQSLDTETIKKIIETFHTREITGTLISIIKQNCFSIFSVVSPDLFDEILKLHVNILIRLLFRPKLEQIHVAEVLGILRFFTTFESTHQKENIKQILEKEFQDLYRKKSLVDSLETITAEVSPGGQQHAKAIVDFLKDTCISSDSDDSDQTETLEAKDFSRFFQMQSNNTYPRFSRLFHGHNHKIEKSFLSNLAGMGEVKQTVTSLAFFRVSKTPAYFSKHLCDDLTKQLTPEALVDLYFPSQVYLAAVTNSEEIATIVFENMEEKTFQSINKFFKNPNDKMIAYEALARVISNARISNDQIPKLLCFMLHHIDSHLWAAGLEKINQLDSSIDGDRLAILPTALKIADSDDFFISHKKFNEEVFKLILSLEGKISPALANEVESFKGKIISQYESPLVCNVPAPQPEDSKIAENEKLENYKKEVFEKIQEIHNFFGKSIKEIKDKINSQLSIPSNVSEYETVLYSIGFFMDQLLSTIHLIYEEKHDELVNQFRPEIEAAESVSEAEEKVHGLQKKLVSNQHISLNIWSQTINNDSPEALNLDDLQPIQAAVNKYTASKRAVFEKQFKLLESLNPMERADVLDVSDNNPSSFLNEFQQQINTILGDIENVVPLSTFKKRMKNTEEAFKTLIDQIQTTISMLHDYHLEMALIEQDQNSNNNQIQELSTWLQQTTGQLIQLHTAQIISRSLMPTEEIQQHEKECLDGLNAKILPFEIKDLYEKNRSNIESEEQRLLTLIKKNQQTCQALRMGYDQKTGHSSEFSEIVDVEKPLEKAKKNQDLLHVSNRITGIVGDILEKLAAINYENEKKITKEQLAKRLESSKSATDSSMSLTYDFKERKKQYTTNIYEASPLFQKYLFLCANTLNLGKQNNKLEKEVKRIQFKLNSSKNSFQSKKTSSLESIEHRVSVPQLIEECQNKLAIMEKKTNDLKWSRIAQQISEEPTSSQLTTLIKAFDMIKVRQTGSHKQFFYLKENGRPLEGSLIIRAEHRESDRVDRCYVKQAYKVFSRLLTHLIDASNNSNT